MSNILKRLLFFIILSIFFHYKAICQQLYKTATVGFYNIENLFDTIPSVGYIDGTLSYLNPDYHISIPVDDISKYDTVHFRQAYTHENIRGKKIIRPLILQNEYSHKGSKVWDSKKYNRKIKNLAKVISELGKDITQTAPVIVGLAEVENIHVIEDLILDPQLASYNYGIIHYNSFDARGIDVALIYQKNRFEVIESKPYTLIIYRDNKRRYTRDILRVTGLLDGEKISFTVNHWPSRWGGEKVSAPHRLEAAVLLKNIFDEIKEKDPEAKIIAMGDFNDDPYSPSLKNTFKAIGNPKKIMPTDYYNPMIPMSKKGLGTLAYRGSWNLFDQFITTGNLVDKDLHSYKTIHTQIYSPSYLIEREGEYKGYPKRTYSGEAYSELGYSDHFAIYLILAKEFIYADQ